MARTDLVKQNKVYHYKVPIYLISTRYLSALHILTQLYQNKFLKYILKCCLIYRFQRGRVLPNIVHKSTSSLFYVRIINASIVCITALKFLVGKKKSRTLPSILFSLLLHPLFPSFLLPSLHIHTPLTSMIMRGILLYSIYSKIVPFKLSN